MKSMKLALAAAAAAGILALACGPAVAADVYRWVDEAGKVHYGDKVPDRYQSKSRKMDSTETPSAEQRQEAQQRAVRDRQRLLNMPATPPDTGSLTIGTQDDTSKMTSCELEWKKFSDSNECFAPFFVKGGGIKAEAFKQCSQVAAPTCGPYPGK